MKNNFNIIIESIQECFELNNLNIFDIKEIYAYLNFALQANLNNSTEHYHKVTHNHKIRELSLRIMEFLESEEMTNVEFLEINRFLKEMYLND